MKETQFGDSIDLSAFTKYDTPALHKLFGELYDQLDKAEQSGLKEVFVQFRSRFDPYDNFSMPVEVSIRGKRELNNLEKAGKVRL